MPTVWLYQSNVMNLHTLLPSQQVNRKQRYHTINKAIFSRPVRASKIPEL
jgi:hypothetical protein